MSWYVKVVETLRDAVGEQHEQEKWSVASAGKVQRRPSCWRETKMRRRGSQRLPVAAPVLDRWWCASRSVCSPRPEQHA